MAKRNKYLAKEINHEGNKICIRNLVEFKTKRQRELYDSIREKKLIFALGSAGTGKTFISVYSAIQELLEGNVSKVMFTSSTVPIGNNMGYMPGSIDDKLKHWNAPLFASTCDILGVSAATKMFNVGKIENTAISFIGGTTVQDAILIVDESHNCTIQELKIILTRIGSGKIIFCGDEKQSVNRRNTGFSDIIDRVSTITSYRDPEISFVKFTKEDCIRSGLAKRLLEITEDI